MNDYMSAPVSSDHLLAASSCVTFGKLFNLSALVSTSVKWIIIESISYCCYAIMNVKCARSNMVPGRYYLSICSYSLFVSKERDFLLQAFRLAIKCNQGVVFKRFVNKAKNTLLIINYFRIKNVTLLQR